MNGRAYTVAAVILVLVGVGVVIGTLWYAQSSSAREQAQIAAQIPTVAILPTLTPSLTNTATLVPPPTLPPTFTPTPTITITPSITPTLTFTPSSTPTITDTPSLTPTLSSSLTPTFTLTPTATNTSSLPSATPTDTRSPFPFTLRGGEVVFTPNRYNSAGCAYQGVGGQVFDLQGQGINSGIRVVVVDETGSEFGAPAGSNSNYGGNGGYEIGVDSQPNSRNYFVQLRTISTNVVISPEVPIRFPSDCDRNVAIVNWIQTRPF
ncbi:MAG: hypothetical protein AAFV33_19990 [Chloroflexota bacterium]